MSCSAELLRAEDQIEVLDMSAEEEEADLGEGVGVHVGAHAAEEEEQEDRPPRAARIRGGAPAELDGPVLEVNVELALSADRVEPAASKLDLYCHERVLEKPLESSDVTPFQLELGICASMLIVGVLNPQAPEWYFDSMGAGQGQTNAKLTHRNGSRKAKENSD